MTLQTFMLAYPWDLIDEGVEPVLDRLIGEVGSDGLTVWGNSPALAYLRVRDVEPRVFQTDGGVFFHPVTTDYERAACQPIVAEYAKGEDPLAIIARVCAARSVPLRVVLSASLGGKMAEAYPALAARNVYGVESRTALCLSNPDVRACLAGLVAGLSRAYDLAAVVVSDLMLAWPEARMLDLGAIRKLSDTERTLLATCFCESCCQQAEARSVDVPATQRVIRSFLHRSFEREESVDAALEEALLNDEQVAAYFRWRANTLEAILRDLVDCCQASLLLERSFNGLDSQQQVGMDAGIPAGMVTSVSRPDDMSLVKPEISAAGELRVPASWVYAEDGTALVKALPQAAKRHFAGVTIDHYGLLPVSALTTTVKQAFRFGKRT